MEKVLVKRVAYPATHGKLVSQWIALGGLTHGVLRAGLCNLGTAAEPVSAVDWRAGFCVATPY